MTATFRRILNLRDRLNQHIDSVLGEPGAGVRLTFEELNRVFDDLQNEVAGIRQPAEFLTDPSTIDVTAVRTAADGVNSPIGQLGQHVEVRPSVASWIDNLATPDRGILQHMATDAGGALTRLLEAQGDAAVNARAAELRAGLARNRWPDADIDRALLLARELAGEYRRGEMGAGGPGGIATAQALARLDPAVRILVGDNTFLQSLARENPAMLAELSRAFRESGGTDPAAFATFANARLVTHVPAGAGNVTGSILLGGQLIALTGAGSSSVLPSGTIALVRGDRVWLLNSDVVSGSTLDGLRALTQSLPENTAPNAAEGARLTGLSAPPSGLTAGPDRLAAATREIQALTSGMDAATLGSPLVQAQITNIMARHDIFLVTPDGPDLSGLARDLNALGISLTPLTNRAAPATTTVGNWTLSPGTRLANMPPWLISRRPAGVPRPAPVAVQRVDPGGIPNPGSYYIRPDGSAATCTRVQYSPPRAGMERAMPLGSEVGLFGYDRAHDAGPFTGAEFPIIRYAPAEVNRALQYAVESLVADLHPELIPGAQLFLVTDSSVHPGTDLLNTIYYRLDVVANGERFRLLEVEIGVSNNTANPISRISADEFLPPAQFLVPRGGGN
jgi:hypothetical protein